jgi:hypothetical protein
MDQQILGVFSNYKILFYQGYTGSQRFEKWHIQQITLSENRLMHRQFTKMNVVTE